MKRIIVIVLISLSFISCTKDLKSALRILNGGNITNSNTQTKIIEKFPQTLVSEKKYIESQKGLYWGFYIPTHCDYVEINCSTNINVPWNIDFPWDMEFAILPSIEQVDKFLKKDFVSMIGTRKSGQNYSIILDSGTFRPGHRYYLCVFNNSKGILSPKQYQISVNTH